MTDVHFNMPPELQQRGEINGLRGTGELCLPCILHAKGDQIAHTREVWEPLVNDGEAGQKWINYNESTPIREAVVMGLCEILPGQLVPCCWDHLAALAPPDPRPVCGWCHGSGRKAGQALEVANAPLPPGLNGRGRKIGHG